MIDKKLENAILGFIIGDAIGVLYEFKKRDTFSCNSMRASTFKDSHFPLPLGSWSDDTSLMLCIMDALQCKTKYDRQERPPLTIETEKEQELKIQKQVYQKWKNNALSWMFFGKYTNHLYRIPYDVGKSCRKGIVSMLLGKQNKSAKDISSNDNGGLMRVLPIAFLCEEDADVIMTYIKLFNDCSHGHNISNVGCLLYIMLMKKITMNCDFRMVLRETINEMEDKYKIPEYQKIWDLSILSEKRENVKSTGYVVDTLEAIIWCCANNHTYQDSVFSAVNLGGDTNTIAALTGAIAGVCHDDINEQWKTNIRKKELIMKKIKEFCGENN